MRTATPRRKPHVLLLNSTLGIGGAENVTAALCRGLDRELYDVTVAHLKWRGAVGDELFQGGYDVVSLESDRTTDRADYLSSLRLRKFLKFRRVDLVHTNDLHAMIDAAISRLTVPHVRMVNTFHYGNYPHTNRRYHLAEKCLSRVPDCLVAVGETQRDRLQATYGYGPGRLKVIRNGVPDVCSAPMADLRDRIRTDARPVIGSVSTLIEQKGIDHLLEAAAILKGQSLNFRLVIAGEGHLRSMLEQKATALGLRDYVEFMGWVEQAPSRVLPWLDVFVQTSLWEAMSMVVLEAMSCGLPMVVTNVGENRYVIEHGANGFMTEPKAVDDIAAHLARLIQSDELRLRLGERAREDWLEKYTAARMCREYESLYAQVLGERAIAVNASGESRHSGGA